MKKVYMPAFSEERKKVDHIIDDYYENILELETENIDKSKYQAWLTLFERHDNRESKKVFEVDAA